MLHRRDAMLQLGAIGLGSLSLPDLLAAERPTRPGKARSCILLFLCLPPFDRAYSALLEDLSSRGLLDETLVVTVGEFGRTPKINPNKGREHWGMCYSALVAGGGIRGGQIHGASDKIGAFPKENPVAPEDLLATVHHALGIPPGSLIRDRENRPYKITEGSPVLSLFG